MLANNSKTASAFSAPAPRDQYVLAYFSRLGKWYPAIQCRYGGRGDYRWRVRFSTSWRPYISGQPVAWLPIEQPNAVPS